MVSLVLDASVTLASTQALDVRHVLFLSDVLAQG